MNKHEVPDSPYMSERVISTRIKPAMHRALRQVAASKDASVAAILKEALTQYVAQHSARVSA